MPQAVFSFSLQSSLSVYQSNNTRPKWRLPSEVVGPLGAEAGFLFVCFFFALESLSVLLKAPFIQKHSLKVNFLYVDEVYKECMAMGGVGETPFVPGQQNPDLLCLRSVLSPY